jgi:uncharacterized phage-associated protein
MNTNALAIANYLVDLSAQSGVPLMQFGLMKRVYVTHGFCLAAFDRPAIDARFDTVEAWKNGPVIPSVYHSFKYNGNNPIKDKSVIMDVTDAGISINTPQLIDEDVREVTRGVWKRYIDFTDMELIRLLHKSGTPWDLCYEEGKNNKIPDLYTSMYYKKLMDYERDLRKRDIRYTKRI